MQPTSRSLLEENGLRNVRFHAGYVWWRRLCVCQGMDPVTLRQDIFGGDVCVFQGMDPVQAELTNFCPHLHELPELFADFWRRLHGTALVLQPGTWCACHVGGLEIEEIPSSPTKTDFSHVPKIPRLANSPKKPWWVQQLVTLTGHVSSGCETRQLRNSRLGSGFEVTGP